MLAVKQSEVRMVRTGFTDGFDGIDSNVMPLPDFAASHRIG